MRAMLVIYHPKGQLVDFGICDLGTANIEKCNGRELLMYGHRIEET